LACVLSGYHRQKHPDCDDERIQEKGLKALAICQGLSIPVFFVKSESNKRKVCLNNFFMLKLNVMHVDILILWLVSFVVGWFSPFPQLDLVRVQTPKNGDFVQGSVQIVGTVTGTGFQKAEISFRYQESQTQSWFLITQIDSPIVDDLLANWDTSTIADGTYQIKVLAFYENDRQQETIIENLSVRNYSPFDPIKTDPSGETQILPTSGVPIEIVPTPTQKLFPTPIPPNEMIVTQSQFIMTVIQGAILGILFLFVIALLVIIRRRKLG
jgi:hypothetical protein